MEDRNAFTGAEFFQKGVKSKSKVFALREPPPKGTGTN